MNNNSSQPPYISVIIPSYNRLKFAVSAIQSVLDQDLSEIPESLTNIEIIVVFDGGYEIFSKLIKMTFKDYPNVKFIDKENGGVSSALNVGIKAAKGKFISWLSDDDMMEKHHLKTMIARMLSVEWCIRMKPSIVYGGWKVIDDNDNLISAGENQHDVIPEELKNNCLYPLFKSRVHGCSMLIERNLFIRYGLFDENQLTTADYHRWFTFFQKGNLFLANYAENSIKSRFHPGQDSHAKNSIHIPECDGLWTYFAENFCSITEMPNFDSWKYVMTLQGHLKNSAYRNAYSNLLSIVRANTPTIIFTVYTHSDVQNLKDILTTADFASLLNWVVYLEEPESFTLEITNIAIELRAEVRLGVPSTINEAFFMDYPIFNDCGFFEKVIYGDYNAKIKRLEKEGPWCIL